MMLFHNDDQYGPDFNGSMNSLDSFLKVFLTAGEDTITIGDLGYDSTDAQNGVGHGTVSSWNPGTPLDSVQYHLDIIGDVGGVPASGALAILGLGCLVADGEWSNSALFRP